MLLRTEAGDAGFGVGTSRQPSTRMAPIATTAVMRYV